MACFLQKDGAGPWPSLSSSTHHPLYPIRPTHSTNENGHELCYCNEVNTVYGVRLKRMRQTRTNIATSWRYQESDHGNILTLVLIVDGMLAPGLIGRSDLPCGLVAAIALQIDRRGRGWRLRSADRHHHPARSLVGISSSLTIVAIDNDGNIVRLGINRGT